MSLFLISHIYISPAHNYFNHHGQPPEQHPEVALREVECIAGQGLQGDRFFDHQENYKGQITFFSMAVYEELCAQFGITDRPPSVFRRNVLTRGIDFNTLIGQKFTLQGIEFEGSAECAPCHWMDQAFASGANAAMAGRGGLRARILTSGMLRVDDPSTLPHPLHAA